MSEWFFFSPSDYCLASRCGSSGTAGSCVRRKKPKPSRGALYSAAEHGKLARLSFLLALGKNPDRADTYGITPLQIAAWNNHCKVVHKLIKRGSNVNMADRVGHTALFKAVWRDCTSCVRCLLQAGAAYDTQDKSGNTALMLAAELGFKEALLLLLASGAKPDMQNRWGETALYIAASHANLECTKHLLDFGANPDLQTLESCTALFSVASRRFTSATFCLLKALIMANADPDIRGRDPDVHYGKIISPFELALYLENFFVADVLYLAGCNTNVLLTMANKNTLPLSFSANPQWQKHFFALAQQPRSLADLSRIRIRKEMRRHRRSFTAFDLQRLGLPVTLSHYVAMTDFCTSKCSYVTSRVFTFHFEHSNMQLELESED